MIRFVDLSDDYWFDPEDGTPLCAFIDTITDTFVDNDGRHIFDSLEEIKSHSLSQRLEALTPEGFFEDEQGTGR